ncbi:MAG: N-acetylneuraminate synthase family protein [Desulfobacteraceae bacterium]|nr:N-acetylneuraminate synthase family protein [Desulfobacteraceae bacterium]
MVQINSKNIGDNNPVFITFEAGATHNGYESAVQLVKLAGKAGADAVKFQIFDPDRLVADKSLPFSYNVLINKDTGKTQTITEPLYDILVRRYMPAKDWKKLKQYCNKIDLAFFATVGFQEDIQLLEELGCDSIKIASSDVDHFPLIKRAAETGMCLQLDTGNATFGEIEEAVNIIRSVGNEKIIIHNCPSGYPARLESINLNIIPTLKMMFNYPVAFSDHTPGYDMDIAAVAIGANLVEKTITMDRTTRSAEHLFSLEPQDMENFVKKIKEIEMALGAPRRILHPDEIEKRKATRRSIFLKNPVSKNEKLIEAHVDFKRPGYGISPKYYEDMKTKVFLKNLPAGHMLTLKDLK